MEHQMERTNNSLGYIQYVQQYFYHPKNLHGGERRHERVEELSGHLQL